MKRLYLGDSLCVLKALEDESVDLVYLDPPPRWEKGRGGGASREGLALLAERSPALHRHLSSVVGAGGRGGLVRYLASVALGLLEPHRVLKPTGSLYLHSTPAVSHYLKVLLDHVFGWGNFRSEVVWRRGGGRGWTQGWGPAHEVLLFYSKSGRYKWNPVHEPYEEEYLRVHYRHRDAWGRFALVSLTGAGANGGDSGEPWRGVDPASAGRHWALPGRDKLPPWVRPPESWEGMRAGERLDFLEAAGLLYWPPKGGVPRFKRYLEGSKGVPVRDVIADIPPPVRRGRRAWGPLALLERVVAASSDPGDVVLVPFAGSGTALVAASRLGRGWIGAEASPVAASRLASRLREAGVGDFLLLECAEEESGGATSPGGWVS